MKLPAVAFRPKYEYIIRAFTILYPTQYFYGFLKVRIQREK